jgi:hypothetical protein
MEAIKIKRPRNKDSCRFYLRRFSIAVRSLFA